MVSFESETSSSIFYRLNLSVERLRHLSVNDLAEELSGQYQGDIVITPEQLQLSRRGKTGLIDTRYRWPDNTLPYWIDERYFSKYSK